MTSIKSRGEFFLFAGLLIWCFAFAPYFPILVITAQFVVGPIALVLLLIGVWQARNRSASVLRNVLSLLLFLIALGALYCSSLQTVSMMHRLYPPPHGAVTPVARDWAVTIVAWLYSATIWECWLRSWTDWPKLRCLKWGAVVFVVHIAIAIGFWLILQTDPPRAT
jgi:hypothetical protein